MSSGAVARAEALLEVGRPAEAIKLVRTALAEEPESCNLLCLLSRAYGQAGQNTQALEAAERAIAADPENASGHFRASVALSAQGRCSESIEAAREAVRLAPLQWWTHHCLAMALAKHPPDVGQSLAEAHRVVELAPEQPDAHFVVGFCAQKQGLRDEAMAAYKRVLSLQPDYAVALNNLSVLQMKRGRLTAAARGLRAAAASEPNLKIAEHNLMVVAQRFLRRFYFVLLIAYFIMSGNFSDKQMPPLGTAIVGGAALTLLLGAAIVTDRRLPRALRSYYRRLAIRNPWFGFRVGSLVAALLFIVCLSIPAGRLVHDALRFLAWACLIGSQLVAWKEVRRMRREREPVRLLKKRKSVLGRARQ